MDISTKDNHVQRIRITSHGKIKCWVTSSLQLLLDEASDCKRVVLDTLPASVNISIPPTDTPPRNTPASFHPSTSTVSRLISVVEIIKREYLKVLETTHSPRLLGLHQYNEIGTLEDLGIVVTPSNGTADAKELESARDVKRSRDIIQAISGRHFTRRKETPFMRITLSTDELPELIEKGATYQPPTCRKLSKSAKRRARERAKALYTSIHKKRDLSIPSI
ncbi:hypothetical protein BYT27DRAFT_7104018 [Phlegmacium glaucopus]|nr:hypothetical protein BYT27DRAFT_7104018 [Phlegmacium glaucopus]